MKKRVVIANKIISHLREGNVVKPGSMWNGELRRTWRHPFWEPIIVLLSRFYLPAHDKKHDVKHGYALRESRNVRKGGEDIGEDFGERVTVSAVGRVEK